MIKKILSLFFCMITLSGVICGCDRTPNKRDEYKSLDTDKAAEAALEYMNNKYGEDFYIVSSEERKDHSIIPGKIIDSWIEFTVAIENDKSDNKYFVHVRLNEDKVTYDINQESYMNNYVEPFFNRELNRIMEELGISEYIIFAESIHQQGTKYPYYFLSSFEIPNENTTIEEVAQKYIFNFGISIKLPQNEVNRIIGNEEITEVFEMFSEKILPIFDDDCFRLYLSVYDDNDFAKIKEIKNNSGVIPNSYQSYYSQSEYFNSNN